MIKEEYNLSMWRILTDDEVVKSRKWARDHYKPGSAINRLWHPVVREECDVINSETD